jgi:site-specific recombinase XerD
MNDLTTRTQNNEVMGMVLDGLSSQQSIRAYTRAMNDFGAWMNETGLPFTKATVQKYRMELIEKGYSASTINQRLSAVRAIAREAADNGIFDPAIAQGIQNVSGIETYGRKIGLRLTSQQAQELLALPEGNLMGMRDKALLGLLVGSGLRRFELAKLEVDHLGYEKDRPAILNIVGKKLRVRSIPLAEWTWDLTWGWLETADIDEGPVIRGFYKGGKKIRPHGISTQAINDIVMKYGEIIGLELHPHDLRRTFARLAFDGGSSVEQIQKSLGHADAKTTYVYLGLDQDFDDAPADHLGISI